MARKPKPWQAIEPGVKVVNDRLARCGVGPLGLAEGLALRLATGPMACKYDALLKYATQPTAATKQRCDELCMGNGYQVTLGALLSGLSRLSRLHASSAPLYRCVGAAAAAGVWRDAASAATATCGLLTCVRDRAHM